MHQAYLSIRLTCLLVLVGFLFQACGEPSPESAPPESAREAVPTAPAGSNSSGKRAEPPPASVTKPAPREQASSPRYGWGYSGGDGWSGTYDMPSQAVPADDGDDAVARAPAATPLPAFPWPPPRASAMVVVPQHFFRRADDAAVHLADVNAQIVHALDASAYSERSYYAVPGGFALVTRIEQINPDGTPKQDDSRWSVETGPLNSFSLSNYLRALFTSNPGYFRIIVFVVSSSAFTQDRESVEREQAIEWLAGGLNKLPEALGARLYTSAYATTALIYEFEKVADAQAPSTLVPGRLPGRVHLEKAALWGGLQP